MKLEKLEEKKSKILTRLNEIDCDFISGNGKSFVEHSKVCESCKEYREIGREYEATQKEIKKLLGKTRIEPERKKHSRTKTDPERVKWKRIAATNGIVGPTFENRIYRCGWSYEDAATIPVLTASQAGTRSGKKRRANK